MTQSSQTRKARRELQKVSKLGREPENTLGMTKGTPWTDSKTKRRKYARA